MTNGYLNIAIPISINSSHNQKQIEDICSKAIMKYKSEFTPYFERLIDNGDAGMTVFEDGFEVDQVTVHNSSGSADVYYVAEFYASCKDMRSVDKEEAFLKFEIINGEMVFEIEFPSPWQPH